MAYPLARASWESIDSVRAIPDYLRPRALLRNHSLSIWPPLPHRLSRATAPRLTDRRPSLAINWACGTGQHRASLAIYTTNGKGAATVSSL